MQVQYSSVGLENSEGVDHIVKLGKVIAAIWDNKLFEQALKYDMKSLFLLQGSINTLPYMVKRIKDVGGVLFVDVDFIAGLQADEEGLIFLKKMGINGVITTKGRTIKTAKNMNLSVVLRFFAIDSHAVEKGIEQIRNYSPDYVEILPGVAAVRVIKRMKLGSQVIAAGLLDNPQDVKEVFKSKIKYISTSSVEIWKWYKSGRI